MGRALPSLHALRAFEAAARIGRFNRAAEELCVTDMERVYFHCPAHPSLEVTGAVLDSLLCALDPFCSGYSLLRPRWQGFGWVDPDSAAAALDAG